MLVFIAVSLHVATFVLYCTTRRGKTTGPFTQLSWGLLEQDNNYKKEEGRKKKEKWHWEEGLAKVFFPPVKSVSSHLFKLVLKKEHRRALSSHSNTLQLVLPVQMTKPCSHRYYTINLQASKTCITLLFRWPYGEPKIDKSDFPLLFKERTAWK